jgi:hypothetical protein
LAELAGGELGPALVTVLFSADGRSGESEVLLASSDLPLKILAGFMEEVLREERRLEAGSPYVGSEDVQWRAC